MKRARPSESAQAVALVRAHLNATGVIDDPLAERMLTPRRRALARVMRAGLLSRTGRGGAFSFLAARTAFFDQAVIEALDTGVTQVVIIGAGYDTRAWRLARPGVRFYEVDHPATQHDKQTRAPSGGPTYVPVDLLADPLGDRLQDAGYEAGRTSVFVVEGVTMYLQEPAAEALFATLADLAPPGSRLAVNFTASGGGGTNPASYDWADRAEVPALLDRTGWHQTESLTGPKVAARYLAGTSMDIRSVSPNAFCVSARRNAPA